MPRHDLMEELRLEFEAIGFYLSAHPLNQHARSFGRLGIITYRQMVERVSRGGGGATAAALCSRMIVIKTIATITNAAAAAPI